MGGEGWRERWMDPCLCLDTCHPTPRPARTAHGSPEPPHAAGGRIPSGQPPQPSPRAGEEPRLPARPQREEPAVGSPVHS